MNITKEEGVVALARLAEIAEEGLRFSRVNSSRLSEALYEIGWCRPTDPGNRKGIKAAEFTEGNNSPTKYPHRWGWLNSNELMLALAMIVTLSGVKVRGSSRGQA